MIRQLVALVWLFAAAGFLAGCCQPHKVRLFNGENFDGWETYLANPSVDPDAVWSVRDGVLRCEGRPFGYLRTTASYSDYILHLQWRWPENPTNSGVLLHVVGEDKIWPKCIEAQLKHNDAGDFVALQPGSMLTVDGVVYEPESERIYWKVISKNNHSSENPPGQWNQYTIVSKGDTLDLYVNGVHQNSANDVTPSAGAIGLQSEGSPIEFRNIYLVPLTGDRQ